MNKALSPQEHKLRGTKPSHWKPEPPTDTQGVPEKPVWLSEAASAEWDRVIPRLAERGTITEADLMAVVLYCEAVSRYQAALKAMEAGLEVEVTRLDSNGKAVTVTKPNPAIRLLESTERVIKQYLIQLGLTPWSRPKVKPAQKPSEGQTLLETLRSGHFNK